MAVTGDVTLENGGKQIHPYVVALVRWCVSCLWSAATVVLHRIMITPQVPSITAAKPTHSRAASKDHIHPEPLVQCTVLHEPLIRDADFIFVHGLYGSLENTWRQGDWRSKYKLEPNKVPLRRPSSIPDACTSSTCVCNTTKPYRQTNTNSCICRINKCDELIEDVDKPKKKDEIVQSYSDINKKIEDFNKNNKELGKGFSEVNEHIKTDEFIEGYSDINKNIEDKNEDFNKNTEEFGEVFSEVNVNLIDNYNMQADFVRKLFDCEAKNCSFGYKNDDNEDFQQRREDVYDKDDELVDHKISKNEQSIKENGTVKLKATENEFNKNTQTNNEFYDKNNESNEEINTKTCEIGCGCICDSCYSSCWPRDWLSKDFPNARIISINYTSDPYLWRPLWVKECKRLRLQERAMQMTSQLLELGVGEKPVVWVGHSKGGLFIKQIYAEAYEAYLKTADLSDSNSSEYAKHIQYNTINHLTENVEKIKVKLSFEEQYLEYEDSQIISNKNNTIERENKDINSETGDLKYLLLKEDDLCNGVEITKKQNEIGEEIIKMAINSIDFENALVENLEKMYTDTARGYFGNTETETNESYTDLKTSDSNIDYESSIETENDNLITNESKTNEGPKTVNQFKDIYIELSENKNFEVNLTKTGGDDLENLTQILDTELLVTNESKTNEVAETMKESMKNTHICTEEVTDSEKYDDKHTKNIENAKNIETNDSIIDKSLTENESTVSNTDNNIESDEKNDKHRKNIENAKIIETNDSIIDKSLTENESTVSNTDNNIESNDNNDKYEDKLNKIANLWKNSAGFMFYSVPHRGSALADIKTPLTARSVELLEISKDCSLVQSLQARWLRAVGGASGRGQGPAVRSLVETNRTLMAVLWLRIVSVESADAGIGALCGVGVDHREICKPAGRGCVLYTELLRLIHAGLDRFTQRE